MTEKQPFFSATSLWVDAYVCIMFLLWTSAVFPLLPVYASWRMLCGDSLGCAFRRCIWRYARTMMWLLRPVAPVYIENPDCLLQHAPCVLVANHQSFLDLYLFATQKQSDLCMLAKRWPFRLLFFFAPPMLAAGYINVEDLSAEEVEKRAVQRLHDGAVVIAFPEGKRSRDGRTGRFHAGAFHIAVTANVPVVPLIILGVERVFAVGAKHFTPGVIRLRFLPPLFPKTFAGDALPHRAMMKQVHQLYLPATKQNQEDI